MDAQVLIAGAGPTGLTLAIELARRGIDVRVVDKAECFAGGSRGDGLQPRTLEVFEDLGVLDEVFAAGIGAPLMRIYEGDTVVWEDRMPKLEPPRPDRPYPNCGSYRSGVPKRSCVLRCRVTEQRCSWTPR